MITRLSPLAAATALLTCLVGCGEPDVLRLQGVDDGDYLGGEQVTRFQLQSGLSAARAELRVDGRRVALADAPPFELRWDTRLHSEKRHRITVIVRLDDGEEHEASADITIDNTPPELGELPAEVRDGQLLTFAVSDNFEVSHLELTGPSAPSSPWSKVPMKLTKPFQLTWPGPCGEVSLTVRAFDRAGGETVRSYPLTSADQHDRDCDGHRAIPFGDDCDDLRPWVHGGALETPEGLDLNCDGVIAQRPGTDADGDLVLSISDGGDDCDDSNPFVHGVRVDLSLFPLQAAGGGVVQWSRGEALLDESGFSWLLFTNRAGSVVQWQRSSGNVVQDTALATGATPGVFAVQSGVLAYARGAQVVILRHVADAWTPHSSFLADGPVTRLGMDLNAAGEPVLAYQIGAWLWFARRDTSADAWAQRRIANLRTPLAEAPQVRDLFLSGDALITYRTADAAWSVHRTAPANIALRELTTAGVTPIAMAAELDRGFAVVAAHEANGSALYVYDLFSTAPPRRHFLDQRVAALHIVDSYLQVQFDSGELWAMHYRDGLRRAQTLLGLPLIDSATSAAFASSGSIYTRGGATKHPAPDAGGDRRDTNCDGED